MAKPIGRRKVLSKNQFLFLKNIEVGQEFWSTDAAELMKGPALGGLLSGMYRSGYIEPIYREGKNNILWRRIK